MPQRILSSLALVGAWSVLALGSANGQVGGVSDELEFEGITLAQNAPNQPPSDPAPGETGESESESESEVRGAAAIPSGQELVNIDFPEPTDIKDIVKAVSLWTGKNVILDRNVNGKVQIISPKKVTREEAYQAFLSALNLLGLTTVETGKVIKIMPVRTAVKGNLKTFLGSSWTPLTDEIITQIVPLKYVDAKQIQSTLSRIVSSNSMIAYQPTNTLIISDSGYKVKRVLDILQLLDVQGQQGKVVIVPIKFADAKGIADKVGQILKQTGTAGKAGSSNYRSYKIITDERTNSVVIYGPPRTIADVKELVKKFDVRLEDPTRQATIHVRPLDYADAKKLASTLSALASSSKTSSLRRPPIRTTRQAGRPANTNEPAAVAELGDNLKITADESTNSLLITGSRGAYDALNSIIRKLDMRRSQVFVEADILDINMDNSFNFGTSIFAGRGGPQGSAVLTTWEAGPLGALLASQTTQGATGVNQTTAAGILDTFRQDLSIGVLAGDSVNVPGLGEITPGALIKMLKADGNTRVLATPHILTSNNEEAKITVGEKIFFNAGNQISNSGVASTTVKDENADLTLGVKPNISHSNYVTLKVDLEQNTANQDASSGLPRISKRKTTQLVTVKNGQTVVISGLIQTQKIESYRKIPLLGDIPILGWLFRNTLLRDIRSNLVIFLTPYIVHGADDLAAIYKIKLRERDEFMKSVFGSSFKEDSFYAQLPTAEQGSYKADAADDAEKQRREEMLQGMYRSSSGGTGAFLAPSGGGSDGSFDEGGGGGGDYDAGAAGAQEIEFDAPVEEPGGGDFGGGGGDDPPPMDDAPPADLPPPDDGG